MGVGGAAVGSNVLVPAAAHTSQYQGITFLALPPIWKMRTLRRLCILFCPPQWTFALQTMFGKPHVSSADGLDFNPHAALPHCTPPGLLGDSSSRRSKNLNPPVRAPCPSPTKFLEGHGNRRVVLNPPPCRSEVSLLMRVSVHKTRLRPNLMFCLSNLTPPLPRRSWKSLIPVMRRLRFPGRCLPVRVP